jgi:hypothetical protein
MKIVCTFKPDLHTNGIASTLTAVYGEEFKLWVTKNKPVYDVFDEIKPDIFIGHEEFINQPVKDVLNEYVNARFILIKDENSEYRYPIRDDDIAVPSTNINFANIAQYTHGFYEEVLASDIIYWSRIDKVSKKLEFILDWISHRYRLKIFGPTKIDNVNYLGNLPIPRLCNAIASSKINLDFDNNSRYDAITNKTFSVSNVIIKDTNGHNWFTFEDVKELEQKLNILLNNESKRQELVNKSYKNIIHNQTFFHYCASLFEKIDLKDESQHILDTLGKFL